HRRSVALRAGIERHERFPATDGKRQMALPAVLRRGPSLNQSALFEIAQQAAQISGIEVEAACDLACGRRTVPGDLVEYAGFAERVGAFEKRLSQHPDLPRVKAVETAHSRDPIPRDPILALLRRG